MNAHCSAAGMIAVYESFLKSDIPAVFVILQQNSVYISLKFNMGSLLEKYHKF